MNVKFDEVVGQYSGDIIKLAKRYASISKINDIDDFYSVGMLGFYKAVNSYEDGHNTSIRTYAYKFCKQEMYNLLRKEFRKKQIKDIVHIEAFESPENVCGYANDDYEALECELDNEIEEIFNLLKYVLTERQYKILYKRIIENKKQDDIAEDFGITKQAVQNSIKGSVKRIKNNYVVMNKIKELCR